MIVWGDNFRGDILFCNTFASNAKPVLVRCALFIIADFGSSPGLPRVRFNSHMANVRRRKSRRKARIATTKYGRKQKKKQKKVQIGLWVVFRLRLYRIQGPFFWTRSDQRRKARPFQWTFTLVSCCLDLYFIRELNDRFHAIAVSPVSCI